MRAHFEMLNYLSPVGCLTRAHYTIAAAIAISLLGTPDRVLSQPTSPTVSKQVRSTNAKAVQRFTAAPRFDSLMGPGVSLQLATLRRQTVADVRYNLSLDVTAADSAVGKVTVRWTRQGTHDAFLDFRGRRITTIVANDAPLPLSAYNKSHIRVPAAVLKSGENAVDIEFVSEIAASGASIIKSHDPDGSDYLYTLLVPADANQLFPSFDQPDLKARVLLTLVAPTGWTTIANGAETRADTAGQRVTHTFNETHPLSTYLIAFAAGPWVKLSSTVGPRTVNAYVRKSRAKEADLDTLLALNQRALTWMEEYFARPYPFEKFDFVLAPAFPFGGMEHPGAIFYNENSFIFRERPTLARRIGRFSTILHEVAHQWFGDLVTMRWFDDLWLKEGFATYIAAKAQFSIDSTTGAWKTFYQGNKPSAYNVDQTLGTNSLWQKLANLDQAKSNYGAIVYNKAPSVLKQLNFLVGEAAFQQGVRSFLDQYAYSNATWQQLLGSVSEAYGKPLDEFGRNFMLRPGMPIVEQRLSVRAGTITSLNLLQRPAQALSGAQPWPMRTQLLLSYANAPSVTIPVELNTRVTSVAAAVGKPAPQFVFANYEDYGYFLTLLDSTSIRSLEGGALGSVTDPFLRTMLWGALWDQVRDAKFDPMRFARLALKELPAEKDEQLFPNILGRLTRSLNTYASAAEHQAFLPELERNLWNGANDAVRPYSIRKAYADAFIGTAETTDGRAKLISILSADSIAGEPVRDPTRWEVVGRLIVLDAPGALAHLATQAARDTTPDGKRRAFSVAAGAKSAHTKREYFTRYFADKSLNEDWASGSLGSFNAQEQAGLTLQYLRPALDSLPYIQSNRRIFFLGSWLGSFIGGQRSDAALQIVRKYLADNPRLPLDLRQKVLQTADELERTVKIRKRWN
ncbi:MAG: ERAP1-like C-terminal domain-containing protein [Phycisphaerae bacterium]|nr:ERAP1-like C-terminal domain-containing protein [Gemmatimonadaceae bacterium]